MTKKKINKTKVKPQEVNEPLTPYGENRIQVFSSFEAMNEADAKEMASVSPLQNLKNATACIMYMYADELKNKMTDLTIHLKKMDILIPEFKQFVK